MSNALQTLLKTTETFTAAQGRASGVAPSLLAYYVKTGLLERVSRGVYRNLKKESSTPMEWANLVATVDSIPTGVVCLISALLLYEMTDEFPEEHWIAVPRGQWRPRRKNTRVIWLTNMKLGLTKIKLGQKSIPIFNRERTVIDAFRLLPIETAIKALKIYLTSTESHSPDLRRLNTYANKLRFDISPYVMTLTT